MIHTAVVQTRSYGRTYSLGYWACCHFDGSCQSKDHTLEMEKEAIEKAGDFAQYQHDCRYIDIVHRHPEAE